MIRFSLLTIFPELINSYINESIIKIAQEKGMVEIVSYDLRDWANNKHNSVDDKIFGGGAGMLLKIEPLFNAINDLKEKALKEAYKPIVVATSASGKLFNQSIAKKISLKEENIDYIIICGRYEGFDARINDFVDKFYSIGPYILTGGELGALIIIDSVTRLIPGVLGNSKSIESETEFELKNGEISVKGEYPQFTRPEVFEAEDFKGKKYKLSIDKTLISGHHAKIEELKTSQRKESTEKI